MCEKCDFRNEAKSYELGNEITGIAWFFDVSIAEEIIQEYSIPPLPVPRDLLEHMVQVNDVDPSHVDHVDMSKPIILGFLPNEPLPPAGVILRMPGEPDVIIAPLDGSHRAARALRDGLQVKAYYLHPLMTMACLAATEDRKTGVFTIKKSALEKSERLAREAGLIG